MKFIFEIKKHIVFGLKRNNHVAMKRLIKTQL